LFTTLVTSSFYVIVIDDVDALAAFFNQGRTNRGYPLNMDQYNGQHVTRS